MKRLLSFLLPLCLVTIGAHATDFYSQGATAANTAANWNTATDGSGTAAVAGDFTTAGNVWHIQSAMTLSANWAITGDLVIEATGSFAPLTRTVSIGGNYTNSGTFTRATSTMNFTSTSAGNTLSGAMTGGNAFYNLTFNGVGGAWTFGGNSAEVANTFTITNGTVTAPSTTLTVARNFAKAAAGGFVHNSGTVELNGTLTQTIPTSATTFNNLHLSNTGATITGNANITIDGALTIDASVTFSTSGSLAGAFTLTHNGSFLTSATVNPAFPSGLTWVGDVTFSRTNGGQFIPSGTFNNLSFNNTTGTNTAVGDITVNGTLTTTTGASGTFSMSTFQLIDGGAMTVVNNGRISTANTANPPIPTGKDWSGTTGLVTFNSTTGGQTIPAGTYNSLTSSNTSGTNSVSSGVTVNGTLTYGGGAAGIVDLGTNTIAGTFTPAGTGILSTDNTSGTPLPTGKSWTGTVRYNNSTGGQTIVDGTYTSLNSNNSSGTNTASNDLAVSATLTVASGGTLELGTFLLTGITTTSGTGTIRTSNTTAAPIPTGKTWAPTVEYYATTGGQTIMAGTYTNGLVMSNTSGTNTASGNLVANSVLTISNAGSTLDMGTSTLTGTLSSITNNGTILTANTSATPVASGKNWNGSGTIEYTVLGGGQTVMAGTYNALVLDNTSGINDASNDITVNTSLVTTAGGTFRFNNVGFQLLGGFTASHSGILETICTVTPAIPAGKTWGGTVLYSRAAGAQELPAGTYNNVIFQNTSGTNTVTGTITVNAAFTTTSGGILNMSTFQLLDGGALAVTNDGRINTSCTADPALPSGQDWSGTTGIVNYALTTGNQFIPGGTFGTLLCSNTSNTNTVDGDITVTTSLQTSGGAGGTLDMGTNQLSGAFTPSGLGTLKTQRTGAAPVPAGKSWTGTVNYNNATGGQTIMAGTYTSLTSGNTSGTNAAGGDFSASGVLTYTAGGILDMGVNSILSVGTLSGTGTLRTQSLSGTALPAGESWTGTVEYNAATGLQTIAQGTYSSLLLSNTSGANTAGGNLVVSSGLELTNVGATMNMDVFTLTGGLATITNNGTIQTANTSATPIASGKNWNGTGSVEYTVPAGGQTVMAGTYNALVLDNSSGTNSASNDITVNTSLVTTAGGTFLFNNGGYQLLGSFTPTHNGILSTICTVNPAIPSGLTWGGTILYSSTGGAQELPAGTYNNVTFANTSGTNTVTGTITVNGTLTTTTGTGVINMSTSQLLDGGALVVVNNGRINTSCTSNPALPTGKDWTGTTGTVNFALTTGGQFVPGGSYKTLLCSNTSGTNTVVGGTVDVSGGVFTYANNAAANIDFGTNLLTGSFTTAGAGTLNTQNLSSAPVPTGKTWSGRVSYDAATGGQTVMAGTYTGGLIMGNSSGTQTAEGNFAVNGIITTTSGGTLEMGTNQITGNPSTITNDGTIRLGALASAIPASENWAGSGTVVYTQTTGAQSVITGTYNNLTLLNTSGTNSASGDITVGGTLTTTAGGTFEFNNTGFELIGAGMTVSHAGILRTLSTATLPIPTGKTWGGTVEYIRTTGGQNLPAGTYNILTLDNTSGTVTAGGDVAVNTTLTTTSGGTLAMAANQLTGAMTPTNNGTITTTSTADPAIPSGKDWTGTTGAVGFARTTGGQFAPAGTYKTLAFANTSGTNTVNGDISVSTSFAKTGANAAAILDMGTNQLTGAFSVVATSTGVLRTQNTSATPIPVGLSWPGTTAYDNLTGGQTVVQGTYATLRLDNTSGNNSAGGALVVNTALSLTDAGSSLDMGTFAMSGTMTTVSNAGTVKTSNTSATPFTAGRTWNGTGTLEYSLTTGGQTLMSATFNNNVVMLNSSGTNTATANLTMNAGLTTTAGGTFNMATFTLSGATLTPTHNGKLQTSSTSNPPFPASKTWGGEIEYTRINGGQVVPAGTYNNLTFDHTSGSTIATGDVTVDGALVTTSGGTLTMSANQLAGALTSVTNNGTITTTSTANPSLPAGKNWTGTVGLVSFLNTTGGQFIPAGTYKTVTCTNTSGTNTAVGAISCSGTITTNAAGGTLDMTTFDLSAAAVTNVGTLRTQSTSGTPIPSGLTIAGTVTYDATTGGQTIVPETSYANMTLSNSSGTNTAGGNIVVNTLLTTGSGTAVFDLAANTLTGTGLTPAGGGKITTQNTSAAPIKTGLTWTQEIEYNNPTGGQTIVNGTYSGGLTNSNTSGTNTLAAASAPTVNGNLTLTAGSALSDNDRTLTVSGNILGTGSHAASTSGRITMTGAGATISGATLGNVTLNNATGFSLSGSPTVNGTLTLTSGRLTLGANNLTLGTSAPAIAGTLSSSNMIVATGGGEVRKNFSATGSYLFPVGDGTGPNYSPATVNVGSGTPGGAAYVGVSVANSKHPQNANTTDYLNRYWTVNVNDFAGSDYTFTGTYVDGDIVGTETSISNGRYNGSLPWVRTGAVTAASNQVNLASVTDATVAFTGLSGSNPTVNITPASPTTCSGVGQALTANGSGDPTLTYSWAPSTGLSATTGANVTATISTTVATTQEYTVTVTDGNGFTNTATVTVSVNPGPTITGPAMVCNGTTNTLNATPAGGAWTSSNVVIATVNAGTGEVTGNSGGTANITYTDLNGCQSSTQVTVTAVLPAITGPVGACEGGSTATLANTVSGGTWSSSAPATGSIDPVSGVATALVAGNTTITYSVNTGCYVTRTFVAYANPAPISGLFTMCEGIYTQYNSTIGGSGTWISSNTGVMTINSSSGIGTGVGLGTSIITYRIPTTGCQATQEITVNPTPTAITGGNVVCAGSTLSLASTPTGGTWTSHNTEASTIDLNTGVLTGVAGGSSNVTYQMSTGCKAVINVTTNPLPAAILGSPLICIGGTTTLSSATAGGAWTSTVPSVATVSSGGLVTSVGTGNTTISYTLGTGCAVTVEVTVVAMPGSSTGTAQVCVGGSTTLTNGIGGGTWSSSNTARATVGASTGVVTGVSTGTANITYTVSGGGCYTVTEVTVDATPSAITGTAHACVGLTSTLSHASGGGTWSSTNTSIATVNPSTGVVTAVAAGATLITYQVSATCLVTQSFTSNPVPAAITGTALACVGTTTTLADATPEGTWSSSSTGVAGANSVTGVVTGIGAGNANISYILPSGCYAIQEVTINAAPSAITGTLAICDGASTTLSCTPGGGTWASGNTGVATINATTGDVTTVTSGTSTISYTNTSGCISTAVLTVGAMPAAISGTLTLCNGSTTTLTNSTGGGTWTSSNGAVATVGSSSGVVTGTGVGNSTISYNHSGGCVVTAVVTVDAGVSPITGSLSICVGGSSTLADVDGGGTWTSSNTSVATVGSATGVVTGTGAGNATISYNTGSSCYATAVVSVAAAPAAITGSGNVCLGQTITLSHVDGGGTWSSSNPAVGTVNSATGVVGGVTVGATTITYTPSAGCFTTKYINVLALPAAISGSLSICEGGYTTLTSSAFPGTWSSSTPSVATIGSATGIITGVAAGNTTVTFTLNSSGCYNTAVATVNPLPAVISGGNICLGSTVTYTNATGGGTWSSSNSSVASIGSATGTATGVATGGATIYYTLSTGCLRSKAVTVNPLPAYTSGTLTYCPSGTATLTNSTGGGAWTSDNVAATISGAGLVTATTPGTSLISYTLGTGCARTSVVTVNAALAANTGNASICVGGTTTLANATGGGTWSSSVTANATVSSSTGVVTGVAAGTSNISYIISSAAGCNSVTQVTVNAAPASITGTLSVCVGATTTLSHPVGGGTWSTTNTSIATVGSTDGIVTGVASGYATMTYVLSPGCYKTGVVTVKALPYAITGTTSLCTGTGSTLYCSPAYGTWSSSAPATANINSSSGAITPYAAGTATITYTGTNGCRRTTDVTVNTSPAAITGASTVAVGGNTTLSNSTPSGTWTSTNTAKATVGAADGIVNGVSTGSSYIVYTIANGCYAYKLITVTASKPGGNGYFESDRKLILSVFPNPTNGALTIEAPAKGIFVVYALDGKKVAEYTVTSAVTNIVLPKELAAGAYMCRFNQEDGESTIIKLWYQP
ncbi:MAG: Ig-like domain-containing protein [Taibaiella sp.]|nr:Ig-like domain-containing protein [Taibaiella sp.]